MLPSERCSRRRYAKAAGPGFAPVASNAWIAQAVERRLQRSDGSIRYSVRYDASRLWTTAQVAPALARRPFPLR